MVADAVESLLGKKTSIVLQHLVHELIMAERHLYILQATVGLVDAVFRAVRVDVCEQGKSKTVCGKGE